MIKLILFAIWSMVSAAILSYGVSAWRSKEPVGLFIGIEPPEVKDNIKYNHSVAVLWIVYAIVIEMLGIPLVFLKQNTESLMILIIGVITVISVIISTVYLQILKKYRLP